MKARLLALLICAMTALLPGLAQMIQGAEVAESGKSLAVLDERSITAQLRFSKKAILMGEPLDFEFVLLNASDLPLVVEEGGDYRNALGRPDSFKVKVTDENGKAVFQPEARFSMGGLASFQPLPANGEKSFRLFLPHWAVFDRSGKVCLDVSREIIVDIASSGNEYVDRSARGRRLQVNARAELTILPADRQVLGKLIDTLGAKALERQGNRTNEAADEALRHLSAIDDIRVVPWFVKLIRTEHRSSRFDAVRALAKYDSPEAFEALKEAVLKGRESSSSDDLMGGFGQALVNSPHEAAWAFLQTQVDHPHLEVRRAIFYGVKIKKIERSVAIPLLEQLARDKDELLRSEAIELLQLRGRSPVL